ncbi:cyclohexadienyl dehydrogenase [Aliidongia dinghuensis]|uniref:prephenate dehydrogenase n=1 Tax=Aliidongia dinghuensis TaxID=1867774 RepID=A0A8J3E6C9_9PROT|nr:prephenate/arogenate dehydrogenase family protein [Aliidongia dinghuensis]GGF40183.1 cyclohexadienyl dehydrogenase [Aliidongia dinghuensis]
MSNALFRRVAIIGFGLIGSSLGRAIKQHGLAGTLVAIDRDAPSRDEIALLKLADEVTGDLAAGVADADLVVLATPVSTYAELGRAIAPLLKPGCIVSDVGSVKQLVLEDLAPALPPHVHLVPGHPIAGTERSGPGAGFASLFEGRWCILTPAPGTDRAAVAAVNALWHAIGSDVVEMDAEHHDKVLAITSHLPHLIAYTIVGTAVDLEEDIKSEVVKFSASGFRDFTRIAASDPTMWRDIFLNNREAVLEMLQRLTEDLFALQRAIRWGEGDFLFERFTRARAIRRSVIEAKQA